MNNLNVRKSIVLYRERKITLSEAAHRAELTLWDMQQALVAAGFTSAYSLDDLEHEMVLLGKKKH